jgi:hypothetical protein
MKREVRFRVGGEGVVGADEDEDKDEDGDEDKGER